MDGFPESYKDPLYASLDASNEQKLGIPVGLLSSIRTEGEKTDASRVSSAGAKTPYQFIPATRKAILDKFGIDVTLSPENASEGAALLLRDSLKRNDGDAETAIREYHGGTNPKNWGKVNDAYAGRVLAGHSNAKLDALSAGFAKFMADNPASPPAPVEAPAPAANDKLTEGFGKWMQEQQAAKEDAKYTKPPADPTLVDKLIGAGEAGLTLATGATTGTAGMVGGALHGIVNSVKDGSFGTQQGVQNVGSEAEAGMNSLTYAPKTATGKEYANDAGKVLETTIPVIPLTSEISAAGRAASTASQAVADAAPAVTAKAASSVAPAIAKIRSIAPAIADRVERTISRNPDAPTPGTMASGGSAGTDMATQRIAAAQDLPVPIKLTEGQATRNPDQLRFEVETSKGSQGAALRERASDTNERFAKNFDSFVDQTGAEAIDGVSVGKSVEKALVKEAARDKAEIRVAYKNADKAGETAAPVTLGNLVDHLNESAPDAATAPILETARKRAISLGVAAEDENGQLVPLQTTLKNAERMRQVIGDATDYTPTNIRQSAIIKGLIDSETETAGGPLYRQARRTRENYAKKYENRAIVESLLNRKKGTSDRQVALEDTFKHTILDGSREDLSHLRAALTGKQTPEGLQAWKDLQGATVNWLKDEAFKNSATDQRGNRILSAAQLDKSIRRLEQGNKLDFVFGKKGAQQLRDINDLAKVAMTAPPGTVNTSNTASVLLAALTEAGVTGSMTGLPVPVLSALRLVAMKVKDRRIQKRIEQALDGARLRERHPDRQTTQQTAPSTTTLH